MKETEDNINRCKETLCFWNGRINIVKMTMIPEASYRFSVILIKIPTAFFTEPEQIILNLYGNTHKKPE